MNESHAIGSIGPAWNCGLTWSAWHNLSSRVLTRAICSSGHLLETWDVGKSDKEKRRELRPGAECHQRSTWTNTGKWKHQSHQKRIPSRSS